jgi:hypothetical protein
MFAGAPLRPPDDERKRKGNREKRKKEKGKRFNNFCV